MGNADFLIKDLESMKVTTFFGSQYWIGYNQAIDDMIKTVRSSAGVLDAVDKMVTKEVQHA